MSCKADAKYNFGRASEHDEIVYGGEEAIRRLIIVAAGHQLVCRAPARTCGDTAVGGLESRALPFRILNFSGANLLCCTCPRLLTAARPGAASQRCFNPDDKVTVPEGESAFVCYWLSLSLCVCACQLLQSRTRVPSNACTISATVQLRLCRVRCSHLSTHRPYPQPLCGWPHAPRPNPHCARARIAPTHP